jgi:hypothetical protein
LIGENSPFASVRLKGAEVVAFENQAWRPAAVIEVKRELASESRTIAANAISTADIDSAAMVDAAIASEAEAALPEAADDVAPRLSRPI